MRQLVLSLQRDFKITTILVTHDKQEALSMSDKIALINEKDLEIESLLELTKIKFFCFPYN